MRRFNTIAIEISSLCNRKCAWCPVAYNERPDERMSVDTLRTILEDLGGMKYDGRVELYIYNEPTRDMEWLLFCIAETRRLVPRATIMIATNGDYLHGTGNIMKLYEVGLNQLLINSYKKGLQERRKKWVDALPSDVIRNGSIYGKVSRKARIVAMEDKHDPEHFGDGVFALTNRAGGIPELIAPTKAPLARMCVRPFRVLNIDWRGNALLCCQDYHNEVTIGNVRDTSLLDLWGSDVFVKYRRKLYAKDRSLPLCNVCDCHAGAYPHNVEKP